MPVIYGSGAMLLPPEEFGDDAKAALAAAVEEVAAARPGVHIEQGVVEGNPAKVMIDKAKGADLLGLGVARVPGYSPMRWPSAAR